MDKKIIRSVEILKHAKSKSRQSINCLDPFMIKNTYKDPLEQTLFFGCYFLEKLYLQKAIEKETKIDFEVELEKAIQLVATNQKSDTQLFESNWCRFQNNLNAGKTENAIENLLNCLTYCKSSNLDYQGYFQHYLERKNNNE